jgi:hypothetical protein
MKKDILAVVISVNLKTLTEVACHFQHLLQMTMDTDGAILQMCSHDCHSPKTY